MELPLLPDNPVPLSGPHANRLAYNDNADRNEAQQNAAGQALREVRVKLWRDLWSKVEDVDRLVAERVAEATADLRRENQLLRDRLKYARRTRSTAPTRST